ncbi:MAG: ABC1 kinase family protein [Candidatus Paceibacterota bacterium]
MSDSLPLPSGRSRRKKLESIPKSVIKKSISTATKSRFSGKGSEIWENFRAETASEIFNILSELRGPALKIGQMLSVLEVGLPEDIAKPYREKFMLLQDSVPPIPFRVVKKIIEKNLGDAAKDLSYLSETPVAAASIGQVHRGVYKGYDVAIKVQYPGIAESINEDVKILRRYSKIFALINNGIDFESVFDEIEASLLNEIDYHQEAIMQSRANRAYSEYDWIRVPNVIDSFDNVLISEYIDSTPLSKFIESENQFEKNEIALKLAKFHFSAPDLCKFMHADPHPGNFRVDSDGKLVVLDFGACKALPDGFPKPLISMLRYALTDNSASLLDSFKQLGFIKEGTEIDPDDLLNFLAPLVVALREDEFTYSRDWLLKENERISDPRNPTSKLGFTLTLPSEYVLIHRVTLGMTAIFVQLNATNRFRAEAVKYYPALAGD